MQVKKTIRISFFSLKSCWRIPYNYQRQIGLKCKNCCSISPNIFKKEAEQKEEKFDHKKGRPEPTRGDNISGNHTMLPC